MIDIKRYRYIGELTGYFDKFEVVTIERDMDDYGNCRITSDKGSYYFSNSFVSDRFELLGLVKDYDNVNPDHYKTNDKEVWEYMIEIYGKEKFIAFCELNVFKYSMRVGKKPGASVEDDLGKIKWYAEKFKQLRDE